MAAPSEFEIPDDDFERMMDFLKEDDHMYLQQANPQLRKAKETAADYCRRNQHQDLDFEDLLKTYQEGNVVQIGMFLAEDDPTYSFRLRWGRKENDKDSPLVVIAKLHKINDKNEIQWMYYKPTTFTDNQSKAIAVQKAGASGTFKLVSRSGIGDGNAYWEWDKKEHIAVWELSREDPGILQAAQFHHCKNVMKGVAIEQGVMAYENRLKALVQAREKSGRRG